VYNCFDGHFQVYTSLLAAHQQIPSVIFTGRW